MPEQKKLPRLDDMAFNQLAKQGLFSIDMPSDTPVERQHAALCLIEKVATDKLLQALLQAVVDEDHKRVVEILALNPGLLLLKAKKGDVIQSQFTWVKFDVEDECALSIAVKRKQNNMIRLLLSYYDKLRQTEVVLDSKVEALSAWNEYIVRTNDRDIDVIDIPEEYTRYVQFLVDTIKQESSENDDLNEQTKTALASLLNLLVPKSAVKLDECIDAALFLHALNMAYDDAHFTNSKQKSTFLIRVIGLVESILSPDTAKMLCQGIYYVLEENMPIDKKGESLMLAPGKPFYRSSRDAQTGLGFDLVANLLYEIQHSPMIWRNLCIAKDRDFNELKEEKYFNFVNRCAVG